MKITGKQHETIHQIQSELMPYVLCLNWPLAIGMMYYLHAPLWLWIIQGIILFHISLALVCFIPTKDK